MPIDRNKLPGLMQVEAKVFEAANPQSRVLFERASKSLPGGVPMPWMREWASPFPLFIDHAQGAHVQDVDGHNYVDFCLGDTGALFGHSPDAIADAVSEQATRGYSYMLPTEDAIRVGELLQQRFNLPYWQFAMTATDANRFAIKIARAVTGRTRIAVFNGCYHGSLDETLVCLNEGKMQTLPTNLGPGVDPEQTTSIVEFNDIEALETVLASQDIACLLCEPVLTNNGLIFPQPGFHEAVRKLTRQYGSLLVIDETHTICAGPGGGSEVFDLDADIVTIGKPLSGGIASAVYGYSEAVGKSIRDWVATQNSFVTGIGGTLAGNALAMHAMRASLENVMTEDNFRVMLETAAYLEQGVKAIIREFDLPWHVARLGARVEYSFHPHIPENASEAAQHSDHELERLFRLFFLNRGLMLTIFYNVALVSPQTTLDDIDRHNAVFREFAGALSS